MAVGNFQSRRPYARTRKCAGLVLALFCACAARAFAAPPRHRQSPPQITISVLDENKVAVPHAQLTLTPASGGAPIRGETDANGRAEFPSLPPGVYRLTVEKPGFYPVSRGEVALAAGHRVAITLPHQREFQQRIEVRYTPPVIDPRQTAAVERLSSRDVVNVPYPVNRDYRNVLPFIPGVMPDLDGQFHINGSRSSQIDERMDGFDVSQPVTGLLDLRVSPDALRSIRVIGARQPADLGNSSGEALDLRTGMGDDRFRFSATDFIPSVQSRKGLHIEAFTPRFDFSGPISRGRAWFFDAGQGEYDLSIIPQLPSGADEAPIWRWNNLSKVQWNLDPSNQLTGSFLINRFTSPRNGLDALDPLSTTTDLAENAWFASVKDRMSLGSGALVEWGFAADRFNSSSLPRGDAPYVIRPEGASGDFFETSASTARRYEAIANFFLPAFDWHGRHRFRFGLDFYRVTYDQSLSRGSILIYREDGTLDRQASFSGPPSYERNNVETSGYAEDGWSPVERLYVGAGLRFDWDEILRQPLFSPRLAASYMIGKDGKTKLSAGIGLSYPATNLSLVSLPLQGRRSDIFYAADGATPLGPAVVTSFAAGPASLGAPRFLNWSAGLERMLPGQAHLSLEYIASRGANEFAYQETGSGAAPGLPSGQFVLTDSRRDTYDAFRVTVRYPFLRSDQVLVSYTRSRARTSAALEPSLDSLLFSPQLPGPLPWDSPNRILSWGWAPLIRRFQLEYAVDWRTGYPFNVVNQNQELVGSPGSRRFPDYFSLDLFLERRFILFHYEFALRGGFDDITDRRNPAVVVNNINSPEFLTFEGIQGRAFTGRIRFLGRK